MEQERIIEIEKILMGSRFQFAIKCLHRFTMMYPKGVIAFSPHSIYEVLLSVYFMSSGAIEERLKLNLYLSKVPKYDLIQYYSSRRDSEQSENNASAGSTDYDVERRCWIKPTNFNHLSPLKNIFNNGLEVFDPDSTPTEKIDRINMAIEGAIKNICHPVQIGGVRHLMQKGGVINDMELVLMTVSRLNIQKFQISTPCQFASSNVPNLPDKRKNNIFFSHELNMHVIEFPYTNKNRSLFVFLSGSISLDDYKVRNIPSDHNVIFDLIQRFWTEDGVCTLLRILLNSNNMPSEDCFLKGPTFEVDRKMPIRMLLRDLGIKELLKSDAINLDSSFVDDDSVHLGNAVHRTHVKVTEEDTVAGAVNVINTGREISTSGNTDIRWCNFPCAWLIYDKQRRNVLFAGAFTQ